MEGTVCFIFHKECVFIYFVSFSLLVSDLFLNTSRHPKSLPKKSELWHYWKLSCDRRERIQKGHKFWNVLHEENVMKKYPHDRDHDRKVAEQLDAQSSEV